MAQRDLQRSLTPLCDDKRCQAWSQAWALPRLLVARPLTAPGVEAKDSADEEALQATVEAEVAAFVECAGALDATFIVVSNEVGMGVVPPTLLGRLYRDLLGRANQQVAAQGNEVTLMVAGIPTGVK